jgi:hypothetical protein
MVNVPSLHRTFAIMKGVSIIEDKTKKRRYVQIDLKAVKDDREWIQDVFDLMIAESRKDEKRVPWSNIKARLKKEGRL